MKVGEHREALVSRLRLLYGLCLALLVGVAVAYWVVQIVHGPRYRELAENNRLRKLPIEAARGAIYDRDQRLLVENVPSYNLLLDRSRSADLDASLEFAAVVLGRPAAELDALLGRYRVIPAFTPVLLAENLSLSQVARFGVAALEHPEFEVEVRQLRLYRHGAQTVHVVGYLGEVSQADLRARPGVYRPGELAGKKGIEEAFDLHLRGDDGERVVVVDSRGRLTEEYGREPALPGRSLRLTLDLELQQRAEVYFAEGRVGAAVALDPRTGEILVLASSPSYNPNLFARRLEQHEWRQLVESPHHPLQNRAIQNTYSPGSVFKVVLAAAALSEGVVTPRDSAFCGGSAVFYNRRFRCWKREGHGRVALREALRGSCDVYFYHLGQKLGIERIAEWSRRFGFGHPTGVDIRGEKGGLVPDPEWSLRARGHPWYAGETISVAIGQGPLLVSPLQMARMMAAVANGGFLVTPHLVRSGTARREAIEVDAAALELVRDALWAVVNEWGTGAAARVPGADVAGKTATVQVVRQKARVDSDTLPFEMRDHAWFASFAPAGDPSLVVVVFVEHGGRGSRAAAPLAKELYEVYFARDQRQLSAS